LTPVAVAALIALIVLLAWLVARFEVYCLNDLASAEDAELRYLTRQGWSVLILLWIPFGGLLYLRRGRIR
jgi:hypothetical protein